MSGTLVLDCEGLSQFVRPTPTMSDWIAAATRADLRVVTSSVTLVEARDPKVPQARFDYAISRIAVIPATEAIARAASKLLAAHGLHGHKYALDAIVAATALEAPGRTTILTSDPEDLGRLCGPKVRVVQL
jgi:predicted nucleic acid-binding protein